MAAFKTLTSKDLIIAPLELNKGFKFEGATALTSSNVNIERYLGKNTNYLLNKSQTGEESKQYESLVYSQIKQLYYSNFISGSNGEISIAPTASITFQGLLEDRRYRGGVISGSFNTTYYQNYLPSDLEAKRYFPTGSNETIGVLSIPQYLFGDFIQPNSIEITTNSGSYFDDGEGRLKRTVGNGSIFVGNVIYEHGIIILTGGTRQDIIEENQGENGYGYDIYGTDVYGNTIDSDDILNFVTGSEINCSFSSSYTIYETQYKCTIGESEFNVSQNPSIADGDGKMVSFASQEYFSPYVTTVGLYNDQKDLLAVAKLGQPLPTSQTTDTSVLINIDRQ
jgi:hypothetical protein